MESRIHIEKLIDKVWQRNPKVTHQYLILEVLLDIRDLLEHDGDEHHESK